VTFYLTTNDVLTLNQHWIGPDRLRDFGLLESAVLRPQATVFGDDAYPSIHEKAAALLHSLARNHPFVDGNKRTAWAATSVFYRANGYVLRVDDGEVVALVVDIAEGQFDVAAIAGTLKSWVHEMPSLDDLM